MEDASGAMYMNIGGARYTLSWNDDNEEYSSEWLRQGVYDATTNEGQILYDNWKLLMWAKRADIIVYKPKP